MTINRYRSQRLDLEPIWTHQDPIHAKSDIFLLFLLYCALRRLRCAVARLRCAVARLHCAVARLHCAVARLHCAVARLHCAVARLHCAPARKMCTRKMCTRKMCTKKAHKIFCRVWFFPQGPFFWEKNANTYFAVCEFSRRGLFFQEKTFSVKLQY